MSMDYDEQHVNRRSFLKGAAVTALAATAVGAGAAKLNQQSQTTTIEVAPESVVPPVQTAVSNLATEPSETIAQLAAVQAENLQLQVALEAAQNQIETMRQADITSTTQTEALTIQLDDANNQIGLLAGLVALYEQLDDVDLSTVLENGLTAVSTTITDLVDDLPTLEEGLQAGETALNEFEAQIPLVQNGRTWLNDQTEKLELYFSTIEKILEKTVDRIGPFFDMLNDWFDGVKKWLPFGIGEKATEVMQSITVLLLETPETINGVRTNIKEPLNLWLSDDANEVPLQQNLLNPIRNEVLSKTRSTSGKAKQIEGAYQNQLVLPVETAVSQHQTLRERIAHYRTEHNIQSKNMEGENS
jgi:hypothetical protein